MPFNWTDTSEKLLLMRILQLTAPKLPNFDEVVAGMPEGVTAEACKHRMRKIKKEIESMEVATGAAKTPAKRGASKKATTQSTNKRKAKATSASDDSDQAVQDDEEESPLKKVKHQPVEQESKPEEEEDNDWLV
ncbi:hypothetical protein Slin15195_G056790 [Septoria linicola]|uniref:Myb-like domain-containing protein n=1 Tax=Septoria linicola TaxID=215465 RepID=A0A9Q9ATQ0_9PEZI|nr:hypothetical protein Slin14017_G072670 [Septoria linicola]USW52360.1 hypothetical protein Slin15195_G056790 [Septoria linicola]